MIILVTLQFIGPTHIPFKREVFNSEQKFQFRFGEYGIQPGQLMRPIDVAETINGNYLVSDYDLHCVTVYTPAGAYMSRFGQRYLAGPKGIIADSRGRILVVDQKACMVCIFKPTGKFINRFGARGPADNQFTNPVSVAVNSQDEIYVSDYTQHAIKVFDMNGLYLFRFGVHGMESEDPGEFKQLRKRNLQIVFEIFDAGGDYLGAVNSTVEPLSGPHGIAINHILQRILVTDPGNYCIKTFQIPEDIKPCLNADVNYSRQKNAIRKSSSIHLSISH
ncbi:tripartite motif-containing protein 2/3 [Paragonimus westermani]|uniref:Tripartite motif-containing protein 2/3 n=1 Tax=Paragonimus westermani TaxID=34504 RepID=A0A5J4NMP7_9TREM|nr:tripartite motif-containing protein 2/3 [Paragonimus westermani]